MANIIRTVKDNRGKYEKIDHRPLEDERLSYAARGVLGYLLTKPPGWKITPDDILRRQPGARRLGRDGLRAVFRELEEFGYMSRHPGHASDDGRWEWEHRVYESPFLNPHFSQISPSTPYRTTETRSTETRSTDSRRRQRRRYSNNSDLATTHEATTHEANTHSEPTHHPVSVEAKSRFDHKTRKAYAQAHKMGPGWLVESRSGKFDEVIEDWLEACAVAAKTCKACGKTSPCELADQGECYHPDVFTNEVREVAG